MKPMEPFCPLCGSKMSYASNGRYTCSAHKCPLGIVDMTLEAVEALSDKTDETYRNGQLSMMSGE